MESTTSVPEKLLYKQVKKIPLIEILKKGTKPPIKGKTHAIIEEQSKTILSFCSEDYALRKNSSIYKPFEKLLKENNILFTKTTNVIEGNKFYVDYIIKQKIDSLVINDILPKLSIWNSYDGTVKTQIKFGYHKLLCGNGLSRPVGCQINTSRKHSADEDEFSKETIPHFLELFQAFLQQTKSDIHLFEKLHTKEVPVKYLDTFAGQLKLSREARDMASLQLTKETAGGMTYVNEKGKLIKHTGSRVTLFMVYNALNYAIYHTNPKEVPEFKHKKDKALLELVCDFCRRNKKN